MDWILDFSDKIFVVLDTEGVMAMHEGAFDFVHHQLQIVSDAFENQFLTVSANIENQLQTIRTNIEQYCSASKLDGVDSKSVVAGINNIETKPIKSSVHSSDLSGQVDSKLAIEENEIINPKAPESPTLITEINSYKGLEKSSTFLHDPYVEDSKFADVENDNIEPTAPGNSMLSSKINFGKGLESSSNFVANSGKEDSRISNVEKESIEPIAQEISMLRTVTNSGKELEKLFTYLHDSDSDDFSIADMNLEEFRARKYVQDVDQYVDDVCPLLDSDNPCSIYHKNFKSHSDKEKTCEACAAETKLIDQQECQQPGPDYEILNNDLNLSEDAADFDHCDSDWEII